MEVITMTIKEFNKKFNTNIEEKEYNYGDFYDEVVRFLDGYNGMCCCSSDLSDILEDYNDIFEGKYKNVDIIELESVYVVIEY